MDYQELIKKIDLAENEKNGKNKERIIPKLKELQKEIAELDKKKQGITDKTKYEKYQEFLENLVIKTVDQVMAPTVDDYITVIKKISGDHPNCEQLRKYVIDNYTEESIVSAIDEVLKYQDALEIENSLFKDLIDNVKKQKKKKLTEKLDKPAEFKNNFDFLGTILSKFLKEFAEIEELNYTQKEELFFKNGEEKCPTFYNDLIEKAIRLNQKIDPIYEQEKNISLIEKIKKRIEQIKKFISLLIESDIENKNDALKEIFLKFENKFIRYEDGVDKNLKNFLEKDWAEIETDYNTIKNFFDNKHNINYKESWDSQPVTDLLKTLIDDYNKITNKSILDDILQTEKPSDIEKNLNRGALKIEKLFKDAGTLKDKIIEGFRAIFAEYSNIKMDQLKKLAITYSEINSYISNLHVTLEGLENGIKQLSSLENEHIIQYISENYDADINCAKDVGTSYTDALKSSGKEKLFDYLDDKLNGSEKLTLTASDLKSDTLTLQELLQNELIKMEIVKNY